MWLLLIICFQMYGAKSISTIDKFTSKEDCLVALEKIKSELSVQVDHPDNDFRLACVEEK